MTHCSFTVSHSLLQLCVLLRLLAILDSGHGGQTKDLDGDEADGYDEGQCVGHSLDCSHRRCSNLSSASGVYSWTFDLIFTLDPGGFPDAWSYR